MVPGQPAGPAGGQVLKHLCEGRVGAHTHGQVARLREGGVGAHTHGQLARQPSHQCSLRENIPAQWVGYYQSRLRSAIAQIAANGLRIQQGDSQKLGLQRATVIPAIVPEKLSFWSGG